MIISYCTMLVPCLKYKLKTTKTKNWSTLACAAGRIVRLGAKTLGAEPRKQAAKGIQTSFSRLSFNLVTRVSLCFRHSVYFALARTVLLRWALYWPNVFLCLVGWLRRQDAHLHMGQGDWFDVRSRRSAHPSPACTSNSVKLQLFLQSR